MAESVLFTCCPPAPDARKVSTRRSALLTLSARLRRPPASPPPCRRGVDAALGLGFRYPLHAVGAGFELQPRVNALTDDPGDDLLVTAQLAEALAEHLQPPAFGSRRSLRTCGTDPRRRALPRRRRCPPGFPEKRWRHRWGPGAAAESAVRSVVSSAVVETRDVFFGELAHLRLVVLASASASASSAAQASNG